METNKENKFSLIKQRVAHVLEFKGVNKERFFEKIGMTSANFRGNAQKTPLNSNAIENILREIPEINLQWLITGKGEMISTSNGIVHEPTAKYGIKAPNEDYIPLLPVEAIAGFGAGDWSVTEKDIQQRYLVPDFNRIDFMITVKGSSMYPKYNSGDIVACRKIKEKSFIQWNKAYVIATRDQGILVKRIKQAENEDHYLMVSDNSDFPPYNIPKSEITGIAIVIGTIRLE